MRKPLECGIVVPTFSASMKITTVCHLFSPLSRPLIGDAAYDHINLLWSSDTISRGGLWRFARVIWMEILLKEESRQSRLSIDNESLVEVLCGLGPTIFRTFKVARFVDWLEKHVSDHVPLTGGCN